MARPKGSPKFGGRQKGTPNKATSAQKAAMAASGLSPLDYMLSVLRDETQESDKRLEAAKAAAPYVHARLSTVDANISGDVGLTVEIVRLG